MQYSIINFSTVLKHKDKRIDSGYYHPYHLNNLRKYQAHSKPLGSYILHMSGGATPLGAIYPDTGIPFFRVQNIMQNYLSEPNMVYLTKSQHNAISRSELRTDDVLLTITGSYGKSAVVTSKFNGANINQHSVKMTVNGISPHFLATFLNCKYGYSQSARHVVGDTRPALDYTAINDFFIPNLTDSFQNKIEAVCLEVESKNKDGNSFYNQAENILLSELGLTDWQPKRQIAFIKRYSDIKESERIDADYFQPKYEVIENAIKNYSGGYSLIKNQFMQNKSTFEIERENTYQYVEIGSVNISNGEITPNFVAGSELPANAKRVLNTGDIIISKVRTYRGAITIVEQDGYVGSGAFLVLSENGRINKETLLAFLHSKPLLAWSLKPNTGATYPVIVDDDILNLPIPIFSKTIQTKVRQKITGSFTLRKQSDHLLECAKRAVEIAIEKDEKTALAWLKKETKEYQK